MDTIQDMGRNGYANLGINRNGPMDWHAAAMCNAMLGNELDAAIIELFFPSASFKVLSDCLVAISGADFCCCLNEIEVGINKVLRLKRNDKLTFRNKVQGEVVYLGIQNGFYAERILSSRATNLQAGFGGMNGRQLANGDRLCAELVAQKNKIESYEKWTYRNDWDENVIYVLKGAEWGLFKAGQLENLLACSWKKTTDFNRMGVKVEPTKAFPLQVDEIISSPVDLGTIQFLPSGKLMVLCADHQTTGGYPRIFQLAKASIPSFVQMKPNSFFNFKLINIDEAIHLLLEMEKQVANMQFVSSLRK